MTDTRPVSLDLETHLIQPGNLAPPPVCGSTAHVEPGDERLLSLAELAEMAPTIVRESELIVGMNIAYDFLILVAYGYVTLEDVFDAYEQGRVFDIGIAEALNAIAEGHLEKDPRTFGPIMVNGKQARRYSLDACVKLVLGREDAKANDEWRLKYALLEDTPIPEWPEDARVYPIDDARNAMDVALAQLGQAPRGDGSTWANRNLHNMKEQALAAWCLHLASAWGIRTDAASVESLRAQVDEEHKAIIEKFTGVFIRKDGTADQASVKRAVAKAYGAIGACRVCDGTGKVHSAKTGNPITCSNGAYFVKWDTQGKDRDQVREFRRALKAGDLPVLSLGEGEGCDGTGFDLASAPGLPRTDKGAVQTSRDALMESGDGVLEEYALVSEVAKMRGTYLPFIEQGTRYPINARSNVLLDTGRSSYDGVIQLMPKSGGIRETITAQAGHLIASDDYSAIELCTFAQAKLDILGRSTMADLINSTKDPGSLHTAFAARMIGTTLDDLAARIKAGEALAKNFRQAAKAANFGFGGGMGAATFVLAKRKRSEGSTWSPDGQVEYAGIRLCIYMLGAERCGTEMVTEWGRRADMPPTCVKCLECAEDLRGQWFTQWPEAKPYFDFVSRQVYAGGSVTQLRSGRVRGDVNFTAAANGYFQALAADGAKCALARVSREMYLDTQSPMYGSRVVLFAHDELVASVPEDRAHESALRMAEVMVEGMRVYVPDVHVAVEPALMRRYSKSAGPVYGADRRLVAWEDRPQKKVA